MIKIFQITTKHNRFDTRIFLKQVNSISKQFVVDLLVADGKGNERINNNLLIKDIGSNGSGLFRIIINYIKIINIVLRSKGFEIIHFHDPELIPLGIILKLFGFKIVYDVHELVYEDIKTKEFRFEFLKGIASFSYSFFEKLAIKLFNKFILAESSYLAYYKKKYDFHSDKFCIVRNYPIQRKFQQIVLGASNESKEKRIVYIGTISSDRGVFQLIETLSFLPEEYTLTFYGEFSNAELLENCKRHKNWNRVKYEGYISSVELFKILPTFSVGMCVLHPMSNYLRTEPVKSFEYLQAGVPVIMSDFEFWKEQYSDCVVFVNPLDSQAIAKEILRVTNNNELRTQLIENGYEILKVKSWENEKKKLINCYNTILEK